MAAAKSDLKCLLAAVRQGEWAALMALVDYLQEAGTHPRVVSYWHRASRSMVWWVGEVAAGRRRTQPHEMACRWARNFRPVLVREFRPGWRFGSHRERSRWDAKIGAGLVRYARAAAPKPEPELEQQPAD
jgi:hypothetical protein